MKRRRCSANCRTASSWRAASSRRATSSNRQALALHTRAAWAGPRGPWRLPGSRIEIDSACEFGGWVSPPPHQPSGAWRLSGYRYSVPCQNTGLAAQVFPYLWRNASALWVGQVKIANDQGHFDLFRCFSTLLWSPGH